MHLYQILRKNTVLLFLFSFCSPAIFAQDSTFVEDPFNRSEIWQKLVENPNKKSIWTQYFGRPWVCFSALQREDAEKLRKALNRRKHEKQLTKVAADSAVLWESVAEKKIDTQEEEAAKKSADARFYETLLQHIMPESKQVLDLKKNIIGNFVLLEDIYANEFAALGQQYVRYDTVHPDQKYSKVSWVKEQSDKLVELKNAHISDLKEKNEE